MTIVLSKEDVSEYYKLNYDKLVRSINRIIHNYDTSEDIVQETFSKVFNNIDKYNPEKGSLNTWVRSIMYNTLNSFKRDFKRNLAEDIDFLEIGFHPSNVEEYIVSKEIIKSSTNKKLLTAIYVNGFSAKDAADLFGINESTVRSICRRIK